MRSTAPVWLLIVPTLLVSSLTRAADSNTVRERSPAPKVEYERVEGERCLRPLVRAADRTGADYWNAAARWIAREYPGAHISKWGSILALPPGADGTEPALVISASASFETTTREKLEVCFDVGFTESRSSPVSPESH